jgi:hypothetical protein
MDNYSFSLDCLTGVSVFHLSVLIHLLRHYAPSPQYRPGRDVTEPVLLYKVYDLFCTSGEHLF